MSITTELREYVSHYSVAGSTKDKLLTAIADRIDAEHERQCAESWMRGHDAWAAIDRSDEMAEHGWVRLPKDADGEYIHIGDVMVYADNTKPMEVVALVPPAVFLTEDGPRYANMCRHYHAPTVEDVLREFADRYLDYEGVPSAGRRGIGEALLDEYADKLRLAGDAE